MATELGNLACRLNVGMAWIWICQVVFVDSRKLQVLLRRRKLRMTMLTTTPVHLMGKKLHPKENNIAAATTEKKRKTKMEKSLHVVFQKFQDASSSDFSRYAIAYLRTGRYAPEYMYVWAVPTYSIAKGYLSKTDVSETATNLSTLYRYNFKLM